MNTSQRPDSSGPGGFLGALRGRWQIAPGLAILGLLAAAAYVTAVPRVYTATASVEPSPVPSSGIIQLPVQRTVYLDTEAQIVTSGTVAALAGKMLHSSLSPLALSKQVTVTVPQVVGQDAGRSPDSGVLLITCTASSLSGAASCANAFGQAYLQNRSAVYAASLNAQLKFLQGEVNALQKAIAALNAHMSRLASKSPALIADRASETNDRAQLNALNHQVSALVQALTDTSGGQITAAASPPGKPAGPDKTLVLSGGLTAGLLLGLIVEFWLDRRDRRILT